MAGIRCDSVGVVLCYTSAMFGIRRGRVKASRAALVLAITAGIGLESEFLRIVWSDVKAHGFKSTFGDHIVAMVLGFALWGALPFVFFLISRELKKQGK
jgi:hypothetical protein